MFTTNTAFQAISGIAFLATALIGHSLFARPTHALDTSRLLARSLALSNIPNVPIHSCKEAEDELEVKKWVETARQASPQPSELSTLDSECLKALYCIHTGPKPGTYVKGEYRAYVKPGVPRAQAELLFDSPQLDGTAYHEWEEILSTTSWDRWYWGHWNYTQLCYLTQRPEV